MSILDNIKKGVASSGSNKGKVIYFPKDSKRRIRFLSDIEDAVEITMHDSFDRGIKAVCQKHLGKPCPYCKDNEMRTRKAYFITAWDHEAKEVKIFEGYANNFSPLPPLAAMYETYGTLKDRDYVIQKDGSGTNTKYSVIPMDKVRFKNKTAKPLPKKKILAILDKAFPVNDEDLVDEDDVEDDDDFDNEDGTWEDGEDEEEEMEYDEMSPKELYAECKERGIKVAPKKKSSYYIEKLEEYDAEYEEEDEDEDDDW